MSLTIGVDVGGTKVLAGVVDPDGQVVAHTRRDTPAADVSQTLRRIVEVVTELAAAHPVDAIGIGAAGWIDVSRSTVLFAPNLAWRHEPLRDHVAASLELPTALQIVVENDANAAAWAEFRFGAARTATDSMVMLTIGTGIGGGIVLGGEIVRGAHGIAAELGHVQVVRDGLPCGCGRRGCFEQYASGSALVRVAQATAKDDAAVAARLLDLAGGNAGAIVGPMVSEAALAGDPAATAAFAEIGRWLGTGLADLVQILDPQVLVIGGGVVEAGELLLGPTRAAFAEALAQRGRLPVADVRAAQMGNLAGVVGAADLARRR
jgi:glucokinase